MNKSHALDSVTDAAAAIDRQAGAGESEILEEVVEQAQRCLPEFEHVALSLVGDIGKLETLAATTDLTRQLDVLQSEAGEGPCVEAANTDGIVVVRGARHEQRWPAYIRPAVRLGLRSQLSVRVQSQPALCLSLYSTSDDEIDSGSIGVAEHFVVHAGIALGRLRATEQLRTAIGTRTTIGTAIGILMERYSIDQAQAFSYLVREASTQNRKLRLVASELVEETEKGAEPGSLAGPTPGPPPGRQ